MVLDNRSCLVEMLTGSCCLRGLVFRHRQLSGAMTSCTSAPPDSRERDSTQVQCVLCLCSPQLLSSAAFPARADRAVSSPQSAGLFLPWPRRRHGRPTQILFSFLSCLCLLPVPTLTLFSCPACQDALLVLALMFVGYKVGLSQHGHSAKPTARLASSPGKKKKNIFMDP